MGPIFIAIDGPSGSGKSSTARGVADRLGLAFLDTGAMYRAITWLALQEGVDPDDQRLLRSCSAMRRWKSIKILDARRLPSTGLMSPKRSEPLRCRRHRHSRDNLDIRGDLIARQRP